MKIEKMLSMAYVDEIKEYELPFAVDSGPVLVGDRANVVARLEKQGYKQYESKEGMLYAHEKGEFVFFPDETGYNFAYATKDARAQIMKNWASLEVMILKNSILAETRGAE